MDIAPGVKAVIAFPTPCCGNRTGVGDIITVGKITSGKEIGAWCRACGKPAPQWDFTEYLPQHWVATCQLIPMPPDEDMEKMTELDRVREGPIVTITEEDTVS